MAGSRTATARLAALLPGSGSGEGAAVATGAVAAFALQVGGAGLAYLSQVLLARWLGGHEFGVYTFTIGWSAILAVLAGLGLSTAMLRFVPAYRRGGRWGDLRGLLRVAGGVTALCGAGIALLGCLGVLLLGGGRIDGPDAWAIGFWLVPVVALLTLQQEVARALHRAGLAYGPALVLRPSALLALGAAAFFGSGSLSATTALALTLVASGVALALQTIGIRRALAGAARLARASYRPRLWLSTAAPMLLVSGFVVILMQTDIVFVGAFLGPREAGIYGAAAKTAALVSLVPVAVNAIGAPVLGSMLGEGRRVDAQRMASAVAAWSFWPSLAISAVLAAVAGSVLSLFGPGFSGGTSILLVLLVGQVVSAGAGAVGWLMLLTGHQGRAARVYGAVALLHVCALAVVVPLFGALAAAVVTTVGYGVWNVWLNAEVVRRVGIHPSVAFMLRSEARRREPIAVAGEEGQGEGAH